MPEHPPFSSSSYEGHERTVVPSSATHLRLIGKQVTPFQRRVIVSQDYDEAYIIVAEFDDAYVRHTYGEDDHSAGPSPLW